MPCGVSLPGAAPSIISVATRNCILLSRQTRTFMYVCRDKHVLLCMFVATKIFFRNVFCRDKHVFVAKFFWVLVAAPANDSGERSVISEREGSAV